MKANSPRWTTVSDSPYGHEREALAFLRQGLPDRAPYRVWANFSFVTTQGLLREVDALVVSDNGLYLVEIKSHPGAMSGDGTRWRWSPPKGKSKELNNPRLLANQKAKELKAVLERTKAFQGRTRQLPYLTEVVFLSDPHLEVSLSPPGRFQVYGRDVERQPAGVAQPPSKLRGIVEAFTSMAANPDTGRPPKRVDTPLGERIAKAVDEVGIREMVSRRQVGDYRIAGLLDSDEVDRDTGVVYQDFLVEHASFEGKHRRLRNYPLARNPTEGQAEQARRAAKREFELLFELRHEGIVAPLAYTEHERGPCLIFDYDKDEEPLDRWLAAPGRAENLTVDDRLAIVRHVAEALSYAHRHRVFHRALCPSAVLVKGWRDEPHRPASVRVANWHAGARLGSSSGSPTFSASQHVEALSGSDAALFRAPEHVRQDADPERLDVFSLGCLAGYVFTGAPPAATPAKLHEMLAAVGRVDLAASADNADPHVADLVASCTDKDPAGRADGAAEVLVLLDMVEEEWTLPDRPEEPHVVDARRGVSVGEGRFEVCGRLGKGATAFALLVRDHNHDRQVRVLKVALEEQGNERIRAEAAALDGLRDASIVRLFEGPLEIDGRAALLLSYAGDKGDADRPAKGDRGDRGEFRGRTLASRIGTREGSELLERFGGDLLGAVGHLEEMGVAHRDIKPENLAVAPRGRNEELHLVLFDFSLSDAPYDRVEAGTPGYIDPFLRSRGRWDPAAERYSAAVVLHELATGARPVYGAGGADPAMVSDEVTVDADLFEPDVAEGLAEFFRTALARDHRQRFDTAEEMRRAWLRAFEPAGQPSVGHAPSHAPSQAQVTGTGPLPGSSAPAVGRLGAAVHGAEEVEPELVVPPGTARSTPLAGLPLSNRVVNTLERHEMLTVGDLLAAPLNQVLTLPGVGNKTRKELRDAVAKLREALADAGDVDADAPLVETARSLVPLQRRANEETRTRLLRLYLGLDGWGLWLSQSQLAEQLGVSAGRVGQLLPTARKRWAKQPPVTRVREWVADELAAVGGVAAFGQLVDRLMAVRPASSLPLDGPVDGEPGADDERRAAVAMLRATLAVEADMSTPRWLYRILDDRDRDGRGDDRRVVVARAAEGDAEGPGANELADGAAVLAGQARQLLEHHQVLPRAELVRQLRRAGIDPDDAGRAPVVPAALGDGQLIELAVALCPEAAVTSRLELYPRGLAALDALRASRGAFVAVDKVEPDKVVSRVQARFPEAEPLPGRPALDDLIDQADLDLTFDEVSGLYEAPAQASGVSSSSSAPDSLLGLTTVGRPLVEVDPADEFEHRLARSTGHGGLLVLMTTARRLEAARQRLAGHDVTVVDLDGWLIEELRRISEGGKPSWELLVEADAAGPGSVAWQRLLTVVDRALAQLTDRLAATSGAVLLVHCGLLARFDRLDTVSTWRDVLHSQGASLTALWMLVAAPPGAEVPMMDGKAIPVVSSNEWTTIPGGWLKRAVVA